jgi:hypothetical protein
LHTLGTDDGGAIVIYGLEPPHADIASRRSDGTLSGEVELALAEWVGAAVAAGITFEVLRSCASQLIEKGWKPRTRQPSAETISSTLTEYLSSIGYLDIRLSEVRQVADQGWLIAATADGAIVRGRADRSGQLLHVRVD